MSVQVSCPVFRCTKSSVARCTGYRKTCERYYCQTHTKGTLCDLCARRKQAEMKAGYREILKSIVRKSYSASMTAGVVVLLLVSLLLFAAACVSAFWLKSEITWTIIFILVGSGGLICALLRYYANQREYMRAESVEMDLNNPGFYDYYQEWRAKTDEVTSSYYG